MSKELTTINSEIISLDDLVLACKATIKPLQKGQNILIEAGNKISLLKYEDFQIGSSNPLEIRVNRHVSAYCMGNLLIPIKNDPYTHKTPSKRITAKARAEILGTHRIDFNFDDEFGIHLPSANNHTDLYLTVANKFGDGRIEKVYDNITIITDESLLLKKLQEISRPQYFKENIQPFLENEETELEMPKWITNNNLLTRLGKIIKNNPNSKKPNFGQFNMLVAHNWLSNVANNLEHGDFIYVGSKEEVYVLGVAKDDDGSLYMQGTYTTSTKPMFWFSNNYLGNTNKTDVTYFKKELSSIPGFSKTPFIFSAMGREQDCKNHIFTGEPDIITGDLSEALNHFRTTDFKEFEDIIKTYANKINYPTPNKKASERFFY